MNKEETDYQSINQS